MVGLEVGFVEVREGLEGGGCWRVAIPAFFVRERGHVVDSLADWLGWMLRVKICRDGACAFGRKE